MASPRHRALEGRRGYRRDEAALYVGIGGTKFDDWVKRGLMPKPKRVDGLVVWDRIALDRAFDALPDDGAESALDEFCA